MEAQKIEFLFIKIRLQMRGKIRPRETALSEVIFRGAVAVHFSCPPWKQHLYLLPPNKFY